MTPTQEDREAAAANILQRLIYQHGGAQPWMDASTQSMRMGEQDNHWEVQSFMRHRLAAEERGAGMALEAAAKVAENFGPQESRLLREENYSGEHREWFEPITLPKGWVAYKPIATAIRQIDPAALGAE